MAFAECNNVQEENSIFRAPCGAQLDDVITWKTKFLFLWAPEQLPRLPPLGGPELTSMQLWNEAIKTQTGHCKTDYFHGRNSTAFRKHC